MQWHGGPRGIANSKMAGNMEWADQKKARKEPLFFARRSNSRVENITVTRYHSNSHVSASKQPYVNACVCLS